VTVAAQSSELFSAVQVAHQKFGIKAVQDFTDSSKLVLCWLDYFQTSLSTHNCDEILLACRSSMIEATACLSLGLVRSAVFAIRLELELFIAWLFFNDHIVEWRSVAQGQSEFPLRKQNLNYLDKYEPGFSARFSLLKNASRRLEKDPYSLLSAIAHGSTPSAMPSFENLQAVVQSEASISACQQLQADTSEYLSDVAASWLSKKWHDLPKAVRDDIQDRLSAPQLKTFTS
jgi:hypothetical protein